MSETSSRKPWLWVGVGCLALSLLLICGGVLVCGGFLGGTGLLFSEIQAESVAASELSAREHVQGHAGLLAATGAVVAITTLSTEVVLDEAEVVLQVEGALATVSATVTSPSPAVERWGVCRRYRYSRQISSGTRTPFTATNRIQLCWASGASSGLPSRLPNQWMPTAVAKRSMLLATMAAKSRICMSITIIRRGPERSADRPAILPERPARLNDFVRPGAA